MEAIEFRAYEVCGYWTIVVIRVWTDDEGTIQREPLYKGDHVPIDDSDPLIRAVCLLQQVQGDLCVQIRDEWTARAS